jgi:hypothetical protein
MLPRPEDSPAIAAHNLAAKRIKLRLCKITKQWSLMKLHPLWRFDFMLLVQGKHSSRCSSFIWQ